MTLKIFCDGLCEPQPHGYGCCAFVVYREGEIIHERYGCIGRGTEITNNVAEYRAVRAALKWLDKHFPETRAEIYTDSKLVAEQVNGRWNCHAENLIPLRNECQDLKRNLNVSVRWVPRAQNEYADNLTRIAYREAIQAA